MDFTNMSKTQIAKVIISNKIMVKEIAEQNEQAYEELRKRGIKSVSVTGWGDVVEQPETTRTNLVTSIARNVLTQVGRLDECLETKVIDPYFKTTVTKK